MKIYEVLEYLNQIAASQFQESYDNSKLIVGNLNADVKGVLVCLDSIEAVIDEAIINDCNLIIAHHPIVFSGLKSITGKNYIERVIIKAIKYDIAIFAIHTNLDNVLKHGVNSKIAERLGLKKTKILSPKKHLLNKLIVFVPENHTNEVSNAMFEAGAGKIGNYSKCSFASNGQGTFQANQDADPFIGKKDILHKEKEHRLEMIVPTPVLSSVIRAMKNAHPYEEVAFDVFKMENEHQEVGSGLIGELEQAMPAMDFLKKIKSDMRTSCIRYTSICKNEIKKVAICGGSGSFLLKDAISAGADIFVTADYKYHQFFDAEDHLIIADIGHYESEQFTIDLIYDLLIKKFSNFAVRKTKIVTNPINYL